MDKTKLKKKIKSFATNCAMAAAMLTLALNYAMIIWAGEGMVWLLICDIICFVGDIFFATSDWKKIKKLLNFNFNQPSRLIKYKAKKKAASKEEE